MTGLRFFLDSADVQQFERWLPTGLFYGVTTNPLLLKQANLPCQVFELERLSTQAFQLGAQEVQLQAWGEGQAAYCQTGLALANDPRIVVKVPTTQAGVAAAAELVSEGIDVTLTAVYAEHQVLVAAAIGATYAAPYLGRISDSGRSGLEVVRTMQAAIAGTESSLRLLVASIRQIADLPTLAAAGLNTFTISPQLAEQLFDVSETQAATAAFEAAAQG